MGDLTNKRKGQPAMRFIAIINGYKTTIEPKIDTPAEYKAEQQRLKTCFDTGKRYSLKKVFQRICPCCGDIYYTTTATQIYDTDRCKEKAKRDRGKTVAICSCLECGQAFTPVRKDAKFCSDKCRQKSYRYRKQPRQHGQGRISVTH